MLTISRDIVDSTNDTAELLAGEHPGRRFVVIAEQQRAGRGRNARSWHSPPGGLWMTLAWPDPRPAHIPAAALLAGLAVVRAIAGTVAEPPHEHLAIKWPNDILIDGRKVAGILAELVAQRPRTGTPPTLRTLLIGIGINANQDPASLPDNPRLPATTLRQACGSAPTVRQLADAVLAHLVPLLEQQAHQQNAELAPAIHADISSRLAFKGERVRFQEGGKTRIGTLEGIDTAGRLRVRTPSGVLELASGEADALTPDETANPHTGSLS
jgi:BirA family biotin operon repressor/biotin-[acetyl-CoA-carboxylase] ligase